MNKRTQKKERVCLSSLNVNGLLFLFFSCGNVKFGISFNCVEQLKRPEEVVDLVLSIFLKNKVNAYLFVDDLLKELEEIKEKNGELNEFKKPDNQEI